ncbi:MAG: enoyl-CoA hydratase/isomerase family protein [Deltaproteobacteria bacterium]|nr:enoyl-CoA hydratase/isomerase family protein [Deltaproteobacteria bacterium]
MSGAKVIAARELDGRVLSVRLSAPPGNVLDREMMSGIEGALDAHGLDPRLSALVFEGEGKHFSFGASVEEHTREEVGAMLPRFHALFRRLADLAIPTFAVVRGQCLGGGLELAAWCSWIFASPEAMFGQPEIRLAVFPPLASVLLPWRIGGGRALDLCVSGRSIPAAEAQSIGLVHTVASEPGAAARAFIEKQLLDKSPSSLKLTEKAVRAGIIELIAHRLPAIERLYLEELMNTPDANEGIAAFLEKRPPRWQFQESAR